MPAAVGDAAGEVDVPAAGASPDDAHALVGEQHDGQHDGEAVVRAHRLSGRRGHQYPDESPPRVAFRGVARVALFGALSQRKTCRLMTSRWIWLVPSKIWVTLASRM